MNYYKKKVGSRSEKHNIELKKWDLDQLYEIIYDWSNGVYNTIEVEILINAMPIYCEYVVQF